MIRVTTGEVFFTAGCSVPISLVFIMSCFLDPGGCEQSMGMMEDVLW